MVTLKVGNQDLENLLGGWWAGANDNKKVKRVMAAAKVWAAAHSFTADVQVAQLYSSKASAKALVAYLRAHNAITTVRDYSRHMVSLLEVLQQKQPAGLQLDAAVADEIKAVLNTAKNQAEAEYTAGRKKRTAADAGLESQGDDDDSEDEEEEESSAADMQLSIELLSEVAGADAKAEVMEEMQAQLAELVQAVLQG
ncbi:hypothetical protein OEZ86_006808 [Tetradesmus obliquus]|nr:hypothetical protein OEZ86_006808 [Tetradesmus obliquus]